MNLFTCGGYSQCWYQFYYFKPDVDDYISRQLRHFKNDSKPHIDTFAVISGATFGSRNMSFDYVIRALGSNELTARRPNRVRQIALSIAEETNATYSPQLLYKARATRSLKYLDAQARIAELTDVYRINDQVDLNGKKVLVVDDISTTGTTLQAIGSVVLSQYPFVELNGYCLAHTKSMQYDGVSRNKSEWEQLYNDAFVG